MAHSTPNYLSISTAAVFPRGRPLPETDDYTLFFYTRAENKLITGMACATPKSQVFEQLQRFKAAGAIYLWYSWPKAMPPDWSMPMTTDLSNPSQILDHALVYDLLDEGMSVAEIAKQLSAHTSAIYYIKDKKAQGHAPEKHNYGQKNLDHGAVAEDLRLGLLSQQQLAIKYGVSRYTINKINMRIKQAA
jgi:hypothetical protein